jgi:excisionase family DNA binding protein
MEKLLTVRELADRLNIAEGTAYHWLSEGRLTCLRFSRRCVRFRECDVQKLLDDLSIHTNNVRPSSRRNS